MKGIPTQIGKGKEHQKDNNREKNSPWHITVKTVNMLNNRIVLKAAKENSYVINEVKFNRIATNF